MRYPADRAYLELVGAISKHVPALAHVDADRVLFVAGAARRESKASIRPLTFGESQKQGRWQKPRIVCGDRVMFYEICLRPRFFLSSTPEERMQILLHELWHASPRFDGTLAEDRRHDRTTTIEAEVSALERAWRSAPRGSLEEVLGFRGELTLRAWLSRPPTRFPIGLATRAEYGDRDLYSAIIEQR